MDNDIENPNNTFLDNLKPPTSTIWNQKYFKLLILSNISKSTVEKSISLNEDQKHFNLEDIIQLPDKNPGDIYKKLDSDNNKYSKKFKQDSVFFHIFFLTYFNKCF